EIGNKAESYPGLSVVVPVYNHYSYLFKCISSILRSSNRMLQIVIIDDASPDPRVKEILTEFSNRFSNITYIRNSDNLGISQSQNKAVNLCDGEYVAFVDCDDYLEQNALDIIIDAIEKNDALNYIFTDRYDVDEEDS